MALGDGIKHVRGPPPNLACTCRRLIPSLTSPDRVLNVQVHPSGWLANFFPLYRILVFGDALHLLLVSPTALSESPFYGSG